VTVRHVADCIVAICEVEGRWVVGIIGNGDGTGAVHQREVEVADERAAFEMAARLMRAAADAFAKAAAT
jgi:hypothetical protein